MASTRLLPPRCPLCGVDWSDLRCQCHTCQADWPLEGALPERCPTCGVRIDKRTFQCAGCGAHWSESDALDRPAPARSTLWRRLRWLLRGGELP